MQNNSLADLLHIPCTVVPYECAVRFPLYLRGSYDFYRMRTQQIDFLVAQPTENIPLSTLRKHRITLEEQSGLPCAFYFESLTPYKKQKLAEGGIPFMLGKREIFLPFLGMILSAQERALPEKKSKCSMLTQRFLLTAIYQHIHSASAAQLADLLDVSRMSGTRCMDEIEVLFPTLVQRKGQRRIFAWDGKWNEYWMLIKPGLRSPVVREYHLDRPANLSLPLSGISAICHYSMLDEGYTCVLGAAPKKAAEIKLSDTQQIPADEIPAVIIQVLGYELPFQDNTAVDPLTAIMCLTSAEKSDPRIASAIQEIEEKYLS